MALAEAWAPSQGADNPLADVVAALNLRFADASALDILRFAISEGFAGNIAMVSSFGADSAVLLHLVAQVDPSTPVIMVDTNKLFPDTLRYRDLLAERLGLTDVRSERATRADLSEVDPAGMLWMSDTDACCHVRKVVPLDRALAGFGAWISGRKRFQSATRARLEVFEIEDGRVKVNPLAGWDAKDILAYAREHDLPAHPLVAKGYPSIGCMPCTSPVAEGEDPRAGRWRGQDKTECGIHIATHGREVDGSGI
ncbi:phosphoadenylyl-sulfate reductase [Roseibium aestuarii]|uniref:Adenosine 5'-phosphosulfate reductase n=1 Tax=Roseibium aestuarii TaxID=2600299 RepID=A0ABW4JV34_9HYPH|nr:phosphoadenylyl-sulfate reductase [Roseibium aestuarii]